MSKKNFSQGLNSLLGENQEIASEKENMPTKIAKNNLKKEDEIRATFIINEKLLEKLKAIAYWERLKIKDVVNNALVEAVKKYEKENKSEVEPIPEK